MTVPGTLITPGHDSRDEFFEFVAQRLVMLRVSGKRRAARIDSGLQNRHKSNPRWIEARRSGCEGFAEGIRPPAVTDLDRRGDVAQFFGQQIVLAIIDRDDDQARALFVERRLQGGL